MESKYLRSHKTVAQKIIIANYSIQNSINNGAEKFGVERKSIRKWIQQLPELTQVSVKSKTKTLHKGKKADTKDIEDELVEWILVNRALGIAATSWEVIIKACKLDESLKLKIWILYRTGATDFWREICLLSVQVFILARSYHNLTQN